MLYRFYRNWIQKAAFSDSKPSDTSKLNGFYADRNYEPHIAPHDLELLRYKRAALQLLL
jgi:hypothetical protein